jgi:hypothetical protein
MMLDETEVLGFAQQVRADTFDRLRRAKAVGPMASYYGEVLDALDGLLVRCGVSVPQRRYWAQFIKCDGKATMTDEHIAAAMGVSVGTVRRKRVSEGCAPFGARKTYTDEDIRHAWNRWRTVGGVARDLRCSKRTASVRVRALGLGEVQNEG